jgi:hypothetical protein
LIQEKNEISLLLKEASTLVELETLKKELEEEKGAKPPAPKRRKVSVSEGINISHSTT